MGLLKEVSHGNQEHKTNTYCRLSRLSTARWLYARFSFLGPHKVMACKSFVFTQKFPLVNNRENLFYFAFFHFYEVCNAQSAKFGGKIATQ